MIACVGAFAAAHAVAPDDAAAARASAVVRAQAFAVAAPRVAQALERPSGAAPSAPVPIARVPTGPVSPDTLELMRAAGLDAELPGIAAGLVEALASGVASASLGADTAAAATLDGAAADATRMAQRRRSAAVAAAAGFSVEHVHDRVARRIDELLDAPVRARLLAHYRSPLGRRALAAESSRDPSDDEAGFAAFRATLAESAAGKARLERLGELTSLTGAHDFVARLSGYMELARMHGEVAADPARYGPGFDAAVADLEWQRGIVRFMLSQELPGMLAYTYAKLDEDALEALLAAAAPGDQRRLLEAVRLGLDDVVRAGLEDFAPRWRAVPKG